MQPINDPFYEDFSEFDKQIDDFKQLLIKTVKQDYIAEMQKLRKENATLLEFKKNIEVFKKEHDDKLLELENLKREVKKMALTELMEEALLVIYVPQKTMHKYKKCNKCDENRLIKFKSPSGAQLQEWCECNISYHIWEVAEMIRYAFYQDKKFGDKLYATYSKITERKNDTFVLDPARNLLKLYVDEQFETLNPDRAMFENKEDCQNYCDWLNLQIKEIK